MVYVKRHRFCTAIQRDLAIPALCLNTIRCRIKESGEFNSYWAIHKPFISKKNHKKRVEWCRQHLNWTPEQWSRVLWTDESPFVLAYKAKKPCVAHTQRKVLTKMHERYREA